MNIVLRHAQSLMDTHDSVDLRSLPPRTVLLASGSGARWRGCQKATAVPWMWMFCPYFFTIKRSASSILTIQTEGRRSSNGSDVTRIDGKLGSHLTRGLLNRQFLNIVLPVGIIINRLLFDLREINFLQINPPDPAIVHGVIGIGAILKV